MDKKDPIIVSAVRTPITDFGGALRDVLHEKLATTVMDEVCKRVDFPRERLEDIYWGVVMVRSDENGLARVRCLAGRYSGTCLGRPRQPGLLFVHGGHPDRFDAGPAGRRRSDHRRGRGEHEQCALFH